MVRGTIVDILMTIFGLVHLLILLTYFEATSITLIKGKKIGLVLEERVVPMMHGTIFACLDSKTIFQLRAKIDDTLVTLSGCIVITFFNNGLRIDNSNLMVAFDNEWTIEYCIIFW